MRGGTPAARGKAHSAFEKIRQKITPGVSVLWSSARRSSILDMIREVDVFTDLAFRMQFRNVFP